jgi:hypothetical protein
MTGSLTGSALTVTISFRNLRKANDMKDKTKRAPGTGKMQTKNALNKRQLQTIKLIDEQYEFLIDVQRTILTIFIEWQKTRKNNTQIDQILMRWIDALDIEKIVNALDHLQGTLDTANKFATNKLTMSVALLEKIDELILRSAANVDIKSLREFLNTTHLDVINYSAAAKKAKV